MQKQVRFPLEIKMIPFTHAYGFLQNDSEYSVT